MKIKSREVCSFHLNVIFTNEIEGWKNFVISCLTDYNWTFQQTNSYWKPTSNDIQVSISITTKMVTWNSVFSSATSTQHLIELLNIEIAHLKMCFHCCQQIGRFYPPHSFNIHKKKPIWNRTINKTAIHLFRSWKLVWKTVGIAFMKKLLVMNLWMKWGIWLRYGNFMYYSIYYKVYQYSTGWPI